MSPATIRLLDRMVGVPLCALLTLLRRICEVRRPKSPGHPRKVLFIKLIEQGATVLAYPAVQWAVQRVGRENVYFWVFKQNCPILDVMGMVPPANIFEIDASHPGVFLRDLAHSLRRIRRLGIDTTIDMEFFSRASAIFAYLTGARIHAGLHRFTAETVYRGDLLTHRVCYNPYLHTAELFEVLVRAAFEEPTPDSIYKGARSQVLPEPPLFHPSSDLKARVCRLLEEVSGGNIGRPIVLLNPNASDLLPLRRWPEERFVELAQRLADAYPRGAILFTGAPAEEEAAQAIAGRAGRPRVFSVAGRTTLEELLTLYGMADVLVTNDSGPGHFAALTPIHSVVRFGPETPRLYGSRTARAQAISAELACSPCVSAYNHRFSPSRDNLCMQAITVDVVFKAVASALAKRPAGSEFCPQGHDEAP
ncbi:MAG: glycosyltransferase family 9 protein [Chthonomonadales bacterium]